MRSFTLLTLALIVSPLVAQEKPAAPDADPRKLLHRFLLTQTQKHFDARRTAVAELKTPDDIRQRQKILKEKFVQALGGFPERTPLNPKVVGTVKGEGFRVEKVIYESRPMHHVSANLYLPDGKGPFPGVLLPCGHSANGKAAEAYQRAAILMAQHGMAVLCYDPIGQGERIQLLDKSGKPGIAGSTSEHTMVGVGALLVGQSTATYRIWDGIRSLDYLASRPEVDAKRLGCTGNSGGGTLTSYLMALDERIACAAPSCYLTTLERLFATIGPQDAEQNITGQVAFGMEHADYITLRAPLPTLMCVATQDFFDIGGAKTTFKEASAIYTKMGAGEKVAFFEFDDKHGFSKPRREAATRWLKRWLVGADDQLVEGSFPSFKDADLQCTRSGQVLEDFQGKSAFHLNLAEAQRLEKERRLLTRQDLDHIGRVISSIQRRSLKAGELNRLNKALFESEPVAWRDFKVTKISLETEPGIHVPITFFAAERPREKIALYVHEHGLDGGTETIARLLKEGSSVASVDLRGWGEIGPAKVAGKKPAYFGGDFKESFLGFHLNRPLLGQRVHDLMCVINFFRGADDAGRASPEQFALVAVGNAGPVALHAAALHGRIESLTLEGSLVSWMNVVQTPVSINQLTNVVPGVLRHYDLPELAGLVAPRPLTIRNPVDAAGRPVSQADLERAYDLCREAYGKQGAARSLNLLAAAR